MELVVLNVAYPFAPVGLDVLGDAEKTLAGLDSALVQAGHESFVMACEGSVTQGILLATPGPSGRLDEAERYRIHEQYRFTLQTFLKKWPIDLIHMHGLDFYEYLPEPGVPVLVTLHSPIDLYPETIFHLDRPQTFLHCPSADQRRGCPPCDYLLPETADGITSVVGEAGIEKYLSIYERLVEEARALETAVAAAGQIEEADSVPA
jgi:Glycosyltransferase Family 4